MTEHLDPHCPECYAFIKKVDAKIDPLHPDGIRDKIDRNQVGLAKLQEELLELRSEWRESKASAKGILIGATVAAGVSGGGIATLVVRIWGT